MRKQGQAVPDLDTKVSPFPHLTQTWNGFYALSSDRQLGMSIGPIPWTSIDRYAVRHNIDGERFGIFERLIRAMDAAFLKHRADQLPRR